MIHTKLARLFSGGFVAAMVAGTAPAHADNEKITGTYEVKYDEVTRCEDVGLTMTRGALTIEQKKNKVIVGIEGVPRMSGTILPQSNKLKAQSDRGPSTIGGLDGQYSISGRVDAGVLDLVFVIEYYRDKKPYCSQSWNVAGVKKSELDKKASGPMTWASAVRLVARAQ